MFAQEVVVRDPHTDARNYSPCEHVFCVNAFCLLFRFSEKRRDDSIVTTSIVILIAAGVGNSGAVGECLTLMVSYYGF